MNITRKCRDTYPDQITVTDMTTGLPVNILGFLFVLTIDPCNAPTSAVNNLYSLQGAIVNATYGTVAFEPTSLQADQIPGIYHYDVQMTDTSGLKRTIASGKYTYVQDISL